MENCEFYKWLYKTLLCGSKFSASKKTICYTFMYIVSKIKIKAQGVYRNFAV